MFRSPGRYPGRATAGEHRIERVNRRRAGPCADAASHSLGRYDHQRAAPMTDRLEEIIVTASKRETNLIDTPLAITALTQDFARARRHQNARDLTGMVPNVQLGTGPDSGTAVNMRGITSTDFTEVGEGSVAIHLDGFYSPRPQGMLALMYDLDRVEVLRGPQGTLFGMNASGGMINIIPAARASTARFAKVDGTFGNYDDGEVRGMLNLPLGETISRCALLVHGGPARRHAAPGKGRRRTSRTPRTASSLDGIPDVDQRRNHDVRRADWYNNADQWGARLIGRWQATDWLEADRHVSRIISDQGAGDIDFVDCEQAAGTVNACTHDLRWVNINVPGEKHLTIDDYQLKLVAQS